MQIDEIKREYLKTVDEKGQYDEAVKNGSLESNEDVKYVIKRLQENIETMQALCKKWLYDEHIPNPSNDTAEGFD